MQFINNAFIFLQRYLCCISFEYSDEPTISTTGSTVSTVSTAGSNIKHVRQLDNITPVAGIVVDHPKPATSHQKQDTNQESNPTVKIISKLIIKED